MLRCAYIRGQFCTHEWTEESQESGEDLKYQQGMKNQTLEEVEWEPRGREAKEKDPSKFTRRDSEMEAQTQPLWTAGFSVKCVHVCLVAVSVAGRGRDILLQEGGVCTSCR